MANEQNLIPINQRTKSEQREIAKSGGIASGVARQERKRLKEVLKDLLELKTPEGKKYKEELCLALLQKAITGDVRAFECIRDTIGESLKDMQGEDNINKEPIVIHFVDSNGNPI